MKKTETCRKAGQRWSQGVQNIDCKSIFSEIRNISNNSKYLSIYNNFSISATVKVRKENMQN